MRLRHTLVAGLMVSALLLGGCSSSSDGEAKGEATPSSEETPTSSKTQSTGGAQAPVGESSRYQGVDVLIVGDYKMPATLVVPETASEENLVPAVVMLHGTGSQRHEAGDGYVHMADALAEAGIASLRIDFMGAGDSAEPDENFDLDNALSDACDAVAYLQSQPGINPEAIGVMGWSQGGLHALRVAAEVDQVSAAVTWAAPAAPMKVSDEQRAEAAEKGYFTQEFDWREPMDTGQKWIDGMDALDMTAVASRIDIPLLLINGSNDDVVPPSNADDLHAIIPSSDVLIIDGADHTFNIFSGDMAAFDELMAATAGFFAENLK